MNEDQKQEPLFHVDLDVVTQVSSTANAMFEKITTKYSQEIKEAVEKAATDKK